MMEPIAFAPAFKPTEDSGVSVVICAAGSTTGIEAAANAWPWDGILVFSADSVVSVAAFVGKLTVPVILLMLPMLFDPEGNGLSSMTVATAGALVQTTLAVPLAIVLERKRTERNPTVFICP